MADEQNSGNGSIRRRPWNPVVSDPVVSTVLLELVGLVFAGIAALVAWPFGWLPDPSLVAAMTGVVAVGPAAELYHAGQPPRRLAVVAALLTLTTVTLLVAAAANWAFPALTDPGVGLLVGYVVAVPVGVAVLACLLRRAKAV